MMENMKDRVEAQKQGALWKQPRFVPGSEPVRVQEQVQASDPLCQRCEEILRLRNAEKMAKARAARKG